MTPTTTRHRTTPQYDIILDVQDYCPRCNEPAINDDGTCENCGCKAHYKYH